MGTLGGVELLPEAGAYDSGLACALDKPPEEVHTLEHAGSFLQTNPQSHYVTCSFSGARSHEQACSLGIGLLQEGLDLLSIQGKADLLTRDTRDEYFAWWTEDSTKWIVIVATVTMTVTLGTPTLTVMDSAGKIVPPPAAKPTKYSLAFRFFRMSRASKDLYDSYRNMYLAFELLLSARCPKLRERESDWLKSSLHAAERELHLGRLVPKSATDAVSWIVDRLYNSSRLPLFHAKAQRPFAAPGTASIAQEELVESLDLATRIVLRMAEAWCDNRHAGGWFNTTLLRDQMQSVFSTSEFHVSDSRIAPTRKDDLNHPRFLSGVNFPALVSEQFAGTARESVYGQVSAASLATLGAVGTIDVVSTKGPLMGHMIEAPLSMEGFDWLETRLFLRFSNAGQPKTIFHVY